VEEEHQDYRGHRIELRSAELAEKGGREAAPVLLVDEEHIAYRQLPGGSYALEQYAYDWQEDLMELARSFIDHRRRVDEARRRERSLRDDRS
jgi:hypothetical protein